MARRAATGEAVPPGKAVRRRHIAFPFNPKGGPQRPGTVGRTGAWN